MANCKYSINGVVNQSIAPINFWMTPAYGDNNLTLYCRNVNGTAQTSVNFDWYPSPSLGLNIVTPKNGQYYKITQQPLTIGYNHSFTIPYLNFSLNGAPYRDFTNGQQIIWPMENNIVNVRLTALPPYAFPYDVFTTRIEENAEVRFTMGDRWTIAITDIIVYFWTFMFFGIVAMFFAYLKDSEDVWQFTVRTIWYLMELLIGFGIIVQIIVFIRTMTGIGG
jgi:hypothetical protein